LENRHPTSILIVAGPINPAWKTEIKESHAPDCVLFVGKLDTICPVPITSV
jgi:hypothetical protein